MALSVAFLATLTLAAACGNPATGSQTVSPQPSTVANTGYDRYLDDPMAGKLEGSVILRTTDGGASWTNVP